MEIDISVITDIDFLIEIIIRGAKTGLLQKVRNYFGAMQKINHLLSFFYPVTFKCSICPSAILK